MPPKKKYVTTEYNQLLKESLRDTITPARVLAGVLVKKLAAQGIDSSSHLDAIKKLLEPILVSPPKSEGDTIELQLGSLGDERLAPSLSIDSNDLDEASKEMSSILEHVLTEAYEGLSKQALRKILTKPSDRLLHADNERAAFVRRLELTWAKPFQLLDIHISICLEIGKDRNDWLRNTRRRSKDQISVEVLTRLHARACQVAAEIQVLLQNGFADGALSRWRTLHELAVTALFILQEGPDAAARYQMHLHADYIKAARQYGKFSAALGYAPISTKEQKRLEKLQRKLEKEYGKAFLGDYGWAASALKNLQPNFSNLEEAVNLDRFRPYFRLASNTVHAGPKGAYFRLGIIGKDDILLAGVSNAGLEEAGRLAAFSLTQITAALLMLRVNADSIIWARVLLELTSKIEAQFLVIKRKIDRNEKALQAKKFQ